MTQRRARMPGVDLAGNVTAVAASTVDARTKPVGAQIRVLLVETNTIVRTALRMLLSDQPDLEVIAAVARLEEASEALGLAPDVVLCDLDDLGLSDDVTSFKSRAGGPRVLCLSDNGDPSAPERAVRLGALGLVGKNVPIEVLFKAIRKVHAGEAWFERTAVPAVIETLLRGTRPACESSAAAKVRLLTPREREVVRLVARGLKNKQLAERLAISEATVRHHLTAIFKKLEIAGRLSLVLIAIENGLS